ncbi:MAG: FMN-binding negative transcriptional regulator [Chitinophagaceae bacterium]|nr:FMN-binding negative transcriptional regulator [Chitinophagaceae bacterium]
MYHLKHFKASEQHDVLEFMKAHPFITLCGVDSNAQPVATHVPVLFEERAGKLYLMAHIMRKQDHTNAFEVQPNVLAIFHGAHAYVSASWYETKNVASTWNYQAVHAKGILKFLDDEALYALLVKLTAHFENDPHSPAQVKKMDETYIKNNMKAIIAFEIELTDIQHVFKLSQNRDQKSFDQITDKLKENGADSKKIAEEMLKLRDQIFPS